MTRKHTVTLIGANTRHASTIPLSSGRGVRSAPGGPGGAPCHLSNLWCEKWINCQIYCLYWCLCDHFLIAETDAKQRARTRLYRVCGRARYGPQRVGLVHVSDYLLLRSSVHRSILIISPPFLMLSCARITAFRFQPLCSQAPSTRRVASGSIIWCILSFLSRVAGSAYALFIWTSFSAGMLTNIGLPCFSFMTSIATKPQHATPAAQGDESAGRWSKHSTRAGRLGGRVGGRSGGEGGGAGHQGGGG